VKQAEEALEGLEGSEPVDDPEKPHPGLELKPYVHSHLPLGTSDELSSKATIAKERPSRRRNAFFSC
jgi:hypothetical protein